jgi:hypothetical protein
MREPAFAIWVTGARAGAVEAMADEIVRRLALRHVPIEVLDARTPYIEACPGTDGAVFVAQLLVRHGVAVVIGVDAPIRAARERARAVLGRTIEVYVRPIGEPVPAGYEPPTRPEVEIGLPEPAPGSGAERVLHTLEVLGLLARDAQAAYSEDEEREVIRRLKAFGYL